MDVLQRRKMCCSKHIEPYDVLMCQVFKRWNIPLELNNLPLYVKPLLITQVTSIY